MTRSPLRVLPFVVATLASACFGSSYPVTIGSTQTPHGPACFSFHITDLRTHAPIQAHIVYGHDMAIAADTDAHGDLYRVVSPATYQVTVTADGYQPYEGTYTTAALDCDTPITLTPVRPPVVRLFAAEQGFIHVCPSPRHAFCDEAGRVWDWRGGSLYRSFGRYLAGEDLKPTLEWLWAKGVNVVRVWPEQDGSTNRTYDRPDFDQQLAAYLDAFAAAGIRVELTAITEYRRPFEEDVRTVQRVFDVAAGRWNVVGVEFVNEPWNGGAPDPVALASRVNRHGVLAAYGLDPAHSAAAGCTYSESSAACPHLDYLTTHLPRELNRYYRNSKDAIEMRPIGVPIVDDEPLGIADYDKDGSGARSTDELAHVSHFAICRLYAAGCTVHSQSGLEGRIPSASEPITDQIHAAIARMWQAIPGNAVAGGYVRAPGGNAGGGDFALAVTTADLFDGRGYGSLLGDVQYVVLPQSLAFPVRPGFAAVPRPGWGAVEPIAGTTWMFRVTR